jgi:diguanylate cyclase (GGDEF)-like protein
MVAEALASPLRRSSTLCRHGPDEFCVIVPECTPEEALGVADRLKEEVGRRSLEVAGGARVRLHISVGVATHDPARPEGEDLLELAEQALARAKADGHRPAGVPDGEPPATRDDTGRVI